jgi:hypothetical protein
VAGRLRSRFFRGPVETGLVIAFVYLLMAAGTATLEWWSERRKIDRGAFTDTFHPFQVSDGMTWPVHQAVADSWPGYPAQFDPTVYRSLVDHAWKQALGAALLEACLIALVVGAVGMALRSVRRSRAA